MTYKILVTGKGTDGVIHTGYRNFATQKGMELGVAVEAINDVDRVFITARGKDENIRRLIPLLREGPPRARVLSVDYYREETEQWD